MAVEDHPLYPKWKETLDHLINAKERRKAASEADRQLAEIDYKRALDDYYKIADEL